MSESPFVSRLPQIQQALADAGLDGWLFAVFQQNDPVSLDLLALGGRNLVTRRCYYLIPREGAPRKLSHRLEEGMLDHLPGDRTLYLRWSEHREGLAALVAGCRRLAAQYSPGNELPAVFELAGTVAPFAILLYAAGRPNIPGERDFWVLSIVYIALGVAAYGLIQYVYAPAWDTMWMRAVSREFIAIGRPEPYEIRVFSTFGSPLQASLFLLTALIPMLVEPKWRRGISYPGAAFIGYVLLLTITRTAWVALAAGVLAYLIIAKGARKIHAIMATVLVTAVVWFSLPYLPGYETISDRLTSMTALKTDTSMTARQSSRPILRKTPSRVIPALFTRMSGLPCSALTLSNAALVDSQSATLPTDAWNVYPSAFCSSSHFVKSRVGPHPAITV